MSILLGRLSLAISNVNPSLSLLRSAALCFPKLRSVVRAHLLHNLRRGLPRL